MFQIAVCFLFGAACCAAELKTNLVQQIDANTLQIGAVRLERKERRLSIPATVNLVEGPIEYVLVSAIGKLHESIFKTAAEPIHIQTAAMLLLKEPMSTNARPQAIISFKPVDGKQAEIEETINNTVREKRLKSAPWRYNGSRLVEGTFLAQRDGSIISIIADPDALIESGRVTAEDDENWRPRKEVLPAIGTPVTIFVTLADPEKK